MFTRSKCFIFKATLFNGAANYSASLYPVLLNFVFDAQFYVAHNCCGIPSVFSHTKFQHIITWRVSIDKLQDGIVQAKQSYINASQLD